MIQISKSNDQETTQEIQPEVGKLDITQFISRKDRNHQKFGNDSPKEYGIGLNFLQEKSHYENTQNSPVK